MSTKVKRYGWKLDGDERQTLEFATRAIRNASRPEGDWKPYTVTRTVRAKGRPLWWAIRQLQEGRAVVDGDGERWDPLELDPLEMAKFVMYLHRVGADGAWAQSWTLAVQP